MLIYWYMLQRIIVQDHNSFAVGNKQRMLYVIKILSKKVTLFISPVRITWWTAHDSIPDLYIYIYKRITWLSIPFPICNDFQWVGQRVGLTSGAHQSGLHSFASIPTPCLVKGHTLFTCACHHLSVIHEWADTTQWTHAVDLSGVGVWQEQSSRDWIHCQVVLMARAVAMEIRETKGICLNSLGPSAPSPWWAW